jgi:DNA polymerase I-like protein with 3'-5' exonuclease and polymerase domains
MTDNAIALDFETYYDNEYSLTKLSSWAYVFHPLFAAYLVALHNDDYHWVGPPKEADWSRLKAALAVVHNASFEKLVIMRLLQDGIIPADCAPREYFDTADMVAYLGCIRKLDVASKELLGRPMSKAVRTGMKGRTLRQVEAAGELPALLKYGGDDTVASWDLFKQHQHLWPECEQRLSQINRDACIRGVQSDAEALDADIKKLSTLLDDTLAKIPWCNCEDEEDNKKPLSPHAIRAYGRAQGIPVPASLAKTDPEVEKWMLKYGPEHPCLMAVRDYRSINTHLSRVQAMRANVREDGTMYYNNRYMGSHTGRQSGGSDVGGGGKFNINNPPRKALYGVDVRKRLLARPGYTLIIPDYSQIEARILLWYVKDEPVLERLRRGENIYQIYAEDTGRWPGGGDLREENKKVYDYSKVCVLGAGYGCGAFTFRRTAESTYGVVMSEQEAEDAIREYRANNPKVVKFWRDHHNAMFWSCNHKDPTHGIELASGRVMEYFDPHLEGRELKARPLKGGNFHKFYGGKLVENCIQATARDILRDAWLALDDRCNEWDDGSRVLWTLYDEFIVEAPIKIAEERAPEIVDIITTSSPWAKGCPLDAEYKISPHYIK